MFFRILNTNFRVFVILLFLVGSVKAVDRSVYVFMMEKWVSTAPTVTAAYTKTRDQLTQIAEAGAVGVNIPLHEKFEYLGPDAKSVRVRAYNDSLIWYAESLGLEVFTSGAQLLKASGLGRSVSIPLRQAAPETLNVRLPRRADAKGFASWPTASTIFNALPDNTYGQLGVSLVSGRGGWLYVNWPTGTHITKLQVKTGLNYLTWVALPQLIPAAVEYYGGARDVVSLTTFWLNQPAPSDLNADGLWVGSSDDQFFHCRALDPQDERGLYSSIFFESNMFPNTRHVADWEELNSPFFHEAANQSRFPCGYPEYLGYMLTVYANTLYQTTGLTPLIFSPDTRAQTAELCEHRTVAPVPVGMPCDFLSYVSYTCPFTLVLWGEGATREFWDFQLERSEGYARVFAFYAGTQSITPLMQALSGCTDIPVAVCYVDKDWPHVISDVSEVLRLQEAE